MRNLHNCQQSDLQRVVASLGLTAMSAKDKRDGFICCFFLKKKNLPHFSQGNLKKNAHNLRRACVAVLASGESSTDRFLSGPDL